MICVSSALSAQTPRFQKYPVMESGTYIYFPAEAVFEKSYSEDSSDVYTCEAEVGGINYGAIIVKFAGELNDEPSDWEALLSLYMEYLASSTFALTSQVDPGYGHTLESAPEAKGILMYGEDADVNQYAIKGWINKYVLAVLFVYSKEEMNINVQNLFLNGFRFSEY